jgi:hypothetical protein
MAKKKDDEKIVLGPPSGPGTISEFLRNNPDESFLFDWTRTSPTYFPGLGGVITQTVQGVGLGSTGTNLADLPIQGVAARVMSDEEWAALRKRNQTPVESFALRESRLEIEERDETILSLTREKAQLLMKVARLQKELKPHRARRKREKIQHWLANLGLWSSD